MSKLSYCMVFLDVWSCIRYRAINVVQIKEILTYVIIRIIGDREGYRKNREVELTHLFELRSIYIVKKLGLLKILGFSIYMLPIKSNS